MLNIKWRNYWSNCQNHKTTKLVMAPLVSLFSLRLYWNKPNLCSTGAFIPRVLPMDLIRRVKWPWPSWIALPRIFQLMTIKCRIVNRCHEKFAALAVDAVLAVADLETKDVNFELI